MHDCIDALTDVVDASVHLKLDAWLDLTDRLASHQIDFDKIDKPHPVARNARRRDPHRSTHPDTVVARDRSSQTHRVQALDALKELLPTMHTTSYETWIIRKYDGKLHFYLRKFYSLVSFKGDSSVCSGTCSEFSSRTRSSVSLLSTGTSLFCSGSDSSGSSSGSDGDSSTV